jgi:hypothetical protein
MRKLQLHEIASNNDVVSVYVYVSINLDIQDVHEFSS